MTGLIRGLLLVFGQLGAGRADACRAAAEGYFYCAQSDWHPAGDQCAGERQCGGDDWSIDR
jgi:hypothetical protein